MRKVHKGFGVLVVVLMALLVVPANAQSSAVLETGDQLSFDGAVIVNRAVVDAPAFVVIHADDGTGAPGAAIGFAPLTPGENPGVRVRIDASRATPTLYAMLHADDNEIGSYEFGDVQGADAPLTTNEEPVMTSFRVTILLVADQIVDNQVRIAQVTVPQPTWVVVHAGDNQNFGAAIGQTLLDAGTSRNVTVEVDPEASTDILWPVLHLDDSSVGDFEFGTVDGADQPLVMGDQTATRPIATVPTVRIPGNQLALGDNGVVTGSAAEVVVPSVLSDGTAFLAIHREADGGGMGEVIGFASVTSGLNTNVTVDVDPTLVTPTLWVALHSDANATGALEFGTAEGSDTPVVVNDQPVAFPLRVAPFLSYQATQALDNNNNILINRTFMDTPGFVIVQADDGSGNPGAVLGQVPINIGLNQNIAVPLPPDQITDPLHLLLYTDTNQIGVFEQGVVGVDSPAVVNDQAVLGELTVSGAPAALVQSGDPCVVTIAGASAINLRSGPGMTFDVVTLLTTGDSITIAGQAAGEDGFTWWQTSDGNWIRSDVFDPGTGGQCPVLAQ